MTKITLDIHKFPCLNDNYGYLVHEPVSGKTAAIDTPDAEKYLAEADRKGWTRTGTPTMRAGTCGSRKSRDAPFTDQPVKRKKFPALM